MVSLPELQVAFLRAVLDGDGDDCYPQVLENGIPAETRVAVYANNARVNFHSSLEAAYPVIRRLGGDEWFRHSGAAYRREYPSHSGNLFHVGRHFSDFLAARFAGGRYDYFADVARLEWAYQESLVAAECRPLNPAALADVRPEAYGNLQFSLRPSARMMRSDYPVLTIWRACQPDATEEAQHVKLDAGPSYVLLIRRRDHVELREISPADFVLLDAFAAGHTLDRAVEAAAGADEAFDLTAALERCIRLGVLSGFRVAGAAALDNGEKPGERRS
jgi:hypothetical protein